MRAIVWNGKRDMRVESVPDPSIVNPHDAILRVTSTAICGSDLHLYNGLIPGMRRGDIMGHEFMGEIVAIGRACEQVRVGDRVLVMCGISCGRCWFCKHTLFSGCDNTTPAASAVALETLYGHAGAALFGYSHLYGGYAGGQAEYVRVPFADTGCVKVPPELSDDRVLMLTDVFPTGYQAAESCNIQHGDTVAVFGAGPVGQFAIVSAFMFGAERVIAIDSVPERLQMAADQGALVIDDQKGEVLARLDELTGGRGPDACIDAVGMEAHGTGGTDVLAAIDRAKQVMRVQVDRPMALRLAIQACRKGGTVSVPGAYGGFIDKFPIGSAFAKGLRIATGQTHFHRYGKPLLDRVRGGEIDPSFVITHRVSFNDLPAAYAMFDEKRDGCVKVIARLPGART
ncbi:MAG: zinc-dependent alcohol dehydrogenase [Kofleriaceae bacterium]|nr:zinc-dependent alcohol dehydrogenase [Kofleriaceae bacterium]